jgi:hypothetical protein
VTERRDDTTNGAAESRPARGPRRSYYYDDATGYETYTPEEDEEDEGRKVKDESETSSPSSAETEDG